MEDKFKQSIKEMTTDELLNIVGSPEKWQPIAVRFANNELLFRNIEPKKIQTAKYLSKKRRELRNKLKQIKVIIFAILFLNLFGL